MYKLKFIDSKERYFIDDEEVSEKEFYNSLKKYLEYDLKRLYKQDLKEYQPNKLEKFYKEALEELNEEGVICILDSWFEIRKD